MNFGIIIWNTFKKAVNFGGFCNNLMSLKLDKTTIEFIQDQLGYISFQYIRQFTNKLSNKSIDSQSNTFSDFFYALAHHYKSKLDQRVSQADITNQIIARGRVLNEQFGMRLKVFLQTDNFKKILQRTLTQLATPSQEKPNTKENSSSEKGSDQGQKQKPKIGFQSPTAFTFPNKPEAQTVNKQVENKITEICSNLTNKPQCLCQVPRQVRQKDENSFKCVHCNRLYHTLCMKKKPNAQFCGYCHLQRMSPLKKVVKTIFTGLLRKTKKKHKAQFVIPNLQQNQKLQVRCIRLKEGAQQFCLFPDIAQISLNGQRCNLFEPINRQSCLKYRKDEPFNILKVDFYSGQINSLLISESLLVNKEKDIRCDPENHLIGFYIIQDTKIDDLIVEIRKQNTLGFSESHQILQDAFGLGNNDDITCQLVKIPLLCPLTTVKIDIPARGLYCTHFQCFDLKNYLTLISESQNPRWKCPLCATMAFQLEVDSIIFEILKETKSNEKIKEILFFKNGDYSGIIDNEPLLQRKNITNLRIPQRKKKNIQTIEQIDKPKRKPAFTVPEHIKVIDIDDD